MRCRPSGDHAPLTEPRGRRVNIDAWSPMAERCQAHLKGGMQIQVHGNLKHDRWQDAETGKPRSAHSVVAESIWLIEGAGAAPPPPLLARAA